MFSATRDPRPFPVVCIFMGVVLMSVGTYRYFNAEKWTEEDIVKSVEVNVMIEEMRLEAAARRGDPLPDETAEERRVRINNELRDQLTAQREQRESEALSLIRAGGALSAVIAVMLLILWRLGLLKRSE